MNVVIGIMIGALAVGLVWVIVYFNQEIHDLRAETRARESTYRPPYRTTYAEFALKKERDNLMADRDTWRARAEELEEELHNMKKEDYKRAWEIELDDEEAKEDD